MTHACYWTITAAGVGAVGPPGQLSVSVDYAVSDVLTNKFVLLADGSYGDNFSALVDTPVTNAQIIVAVEAAIQARETGYPLLVFIPILS
jgi:hypothetical protein